MRAESTPIFQESRESSQNIGERRIAELEKSIRKLVIYMLPEHFSLIKAIVVYGSTARGTAQETSDVDMWIVTESGNPLAARNIETITKTFQDALPGVELSIGTSSLEINSGASKLITKRGDKHPEEKTVWRIIYSVDDKVRSQVDETLAQTQSKMEQENVVLD